MDTHSEHDQQHEAETVEPHEFWLGRYAQREQIWSGNPNVALVDCVNELAARSAGGSGGGHVPGRALELGCGEGADTVWLAEHGWQVTAVDIAENAIERGRAAAAARKIPESQIDWLVADLERWRTTSTFDLVCACFLHSPVPLARAEVLRRAAATIVPGGHLLIVGHLEAPPWASHSHADRGLRTPVQQLAELELDRSQWRERVAETRAREATGPEGQVATLSDSVLLIERLAGPTARPALPH